MAYDVAREQAWVALGSIIEAFHRRGYPSELVEPFAQRKSAERIAETILGMNPPEALPFLQLEDYQQMLGPGPKQDTYLLRKLSIKDFRGIRKLSLDLSANLVLVYGRNGTGKTSVFDAMEYALLGDVERLTWQCPDDESQRSPYVNLFSDEGLAAVSLSLSAGKHELYLRRTVDVRGSTSLTVDDETVPDERNILDEILGSQAEGIDLRILRNLVRTTNFLAQSTLRKFLSNSPEERYRSVSDLLGTHDYGRYLDKVSAVLNLISHGARALQGEVASLEVETAAISHQMRAQQMLLTELATGRDLISRLRRVFSAIREMLDALESPIVGAIPTKVENYTDVQSFIKILFEYLDASYRDGRQQLEKLSLASRSLEALPESRPVFPTSEPV